jgi:hypothetical protein
MFSRFWFHFCHRPHSHRHTGHRAHANGRDRAAAHSMVFQPPGELLSFPSSAARVDCPAQCPLCDKRCSFAAPRCKHGEAFKLWLSSVSPAGVERNV